MVHLITTDGDGHKVARPINSRQEYFEIRNSESNRKNFLAARQGDNKAKMMLAQFNYNDQLPNGVLRGSNTSASTYCHDIDSRDEVECHEIAKKLLDMKEQLQLLELTVSPNWGLHAVCLREKGKTILENQIRLSLLTHSEMDSNAHDQQRVMFTGPADEETLLYLDDRIFMESMTVEEGQEEYVRLKEREENGEEELPANYRKGEKHYRPWEQIAEKESAEATPAETDTTATTQPIPTNGDSEPSKEHNEEVTMLFNHPIVDYVNIMLPEGAPKGQRHHTMLTLANSLIIMLDNNEQKVKQALMEIKWVRDVVKERGEKELDDVISSAKKLLKKRESESFYPVRPSKEMVTAIEELTHTSYDNLISPKCVMIGNKSVTEQQVEMLMRMGRQIKKFCAFFPLLKLMCHRHKLVNYVAILFVGAGFCTTLMTRCWYTFYPAPGKKCRLNSLIMLIGKFGGLKGFAVDLYDLLMEPIKLSDQKQIDQLNAWNRERDMNNGASKSSTARPCNIYRCLPAESSAAGIREVEFNAKEVVDGEDWPLHVSIFDSELNNTLEQMKKSHMDAFRTLWLKSFHNEYGGSLLRTASSPVGEFRIHFNAVYTGTFDAFEKIATESTYSSGIASRFGCILMGPSSYEMMEYVEPTEEDKKVEQQIREWAYKLDATKGEIPTKALSKALYQWTSRKMDEAREEQSEVLEDLCKRPAWYGASLALPFIVSRHWSDMVQDEEGRFKCGAGFQLDKHDIDLALFIAQVQYDFQQYFFYELGQKVHAKQADKKYGKRPQSRTQLAFKRLPEVFTPEDIDMHYGYEGNKNSINSRLKRLQDEGKAQRIRAGQDKGKYRKLE